MKLTLDCVGISDKQSTTPLHLLLYQQTSCHEANMKKKYVML
jgi:hypothetical protein